MFDAQLQPLIRPVLQPISRAMARAEIKADTVTIVGFCGGVAACIALAAGAYGTGLLLILFNRVCDGLDGALARQTGSTARGAFLDIAFDFVFYALVPLGFAIADPEHNALAAAILLVAFVGTGSSFLAAAAIAPAHPVPVSPHRGKGIYYLGGLTEGAETIAVFISMCLLPEAFPTIAKSFAALCGVTTVSRWWWGWRTFSKSRLPDRIDRD